MLKPDSLLYLAVNFFKTDGELKSEGSKWFKSQPMGVNKLNSLVKEMTETAGICENIPQWKENTSSKTT